MATVKRDASYIFGGKVVTTLLMVGTQSCLAWLLGADGRGEYAACLALATLLSVVLGLGVDAGVVYYVGNDRMDRSRAVGAALACTVISSGVAVSLGLVITALPIEFVQKAPVGAMRLGLLMIPSSLVALVLNQVLIGVGDLATFSATMAARAALVLAITFVSIQLLGLGLVSALMALVIGDVLHSAYVAVILGRRYGVRMVWPGADALRRMLDYGWRYYFGKLGRQLNLQLGTVLLACLPSVSKAELGMFAAAISIMARTWMIVDTLNIALLPRTTRDDAGHPALVAKCARLALWASLAALLPVLVFAKPLVRVLLSPEFEGVAPLMWILAGGVLIRCYPKVLSAYFIGMGRPGINSVAIMIGLLINGVLMILLLPPLGLPGAALAVAIGYTVESLLLVGAFSRLSRVGIGRLIRIRRADVAELRGVLSRVLLRKPASTSA